MNAAAQQPLFSTPFVGSKWRVTGHRGAFRVYEVTAIDAETGEFTMTVVEDTHEGPTWVGVGWSMGIERAWFEVRGGMAASREGSVRPC